MLRSLNKHVFQITRAATKNTWGVCSFSKTGRPQSKDNPIQKLDDGLYEVDEELFHELLHAPGGEITLTSSGLGGGAGDESVAAFVEAVHAEYAAFTPPAGDESRVAHLTLRETYGPGPDGLFGGDAPGDAKVVLQLAPKAGWGLDETGVYELGVVAAGRYNSAKDVLTLTVDSFPSMEENRAEALAQLDALYTAVAGKDSLPGQAILDAAAGFAVVDNNDLGVESSLTVEEREEWLNLAAEYINSNADADANADANADNK